MHTYVNAPFINLLMLNAWTKFKINVWEDYERDQFIYYDFYW